MSILKVDTAAIFYSGGGHVPEIVENIINALSDFNSLSYHSQVIESSLITTIYFNIANTNRLLEFREVRNTLGYTYDLTMNILTLDGTGPAEALGMINQFSNNPLTCYELSNDNTTIWMFKSGSTYCFGHVIGTNGIDYIFNPISGRYLSPDENIGGLMSYFIPTQTSDGKYLIIPSRLMENTSISPVLLPGIYNTMPIGADNAFYHLADGRLCFYSKNRIYV